MEYLDPTSIQILTFILGAACLHGFWLSFLIGLRQESRTSKAILVTVLLASSLFLLNLLLFLTGFISSHPHLLGLLFPFLLLIGPGLFFLSKTEHAPSFRWKFVHLIHLLPFLIAAGQSWKTFQLTVEGKQAIIEWLMNPDESVTWGMLFWSNYPMYLLLVYILASIYGHGQERPVSTKRKSFTQALKWAGVIVVLQQLIQFGGFAMELTTFAMEFTMAAMLSLSIHLVGYHKLRPISARTKEDSAPLDKYRTSSLTPRVLEALALQLDTIMIKEKPYLDSQFRLADLSTSSGIPIHQLSQVINEEMHTNFNDWINSYRIEEAKSRLVDPAFQHYSILAIALDCGFQHKSTFNRAFKKVTGKTPSAYIKAHHS